MFHAFGNVCYCSYVIKESWMIEIIVDYIKFLRKRTLYKDIAKCLNLKSYIDECFL